MVCCIGKGKLLIAVTRLRLGIEQQVSDCLEVATTAFAVLTTSSAGGDLHANACESPPSLLAPNFFDGNFFVMTNLLIIVWSSSRRCVIDVHHYWQRVVLRNIGKISLWLLSEHIFLCQRML